MCCYHLEQTTLEQKSCQSYQGFPAQRPSWKLHRQTNVDLNRSPAYHTIHSTSTNVLWIRNCRQNC